MKKFLIIILGIISFIALVFFAFSQFISHIYQRKDCERFVIDHVELRTGINIPAVKNGECSCSETQREVQYTLDLNDEEFNGYLSKNKYDERDGFYINEGVREDTRWVARIDPSNKELKVQLEYLK